MHTPELLFHVGSGALVFVGLAHTMVELIMGSKEPPPEAAATLRAMKDTMLTLPGRKVSVYSMMRGYSLMMGVLLMTVGALGHQLAAGGAGSTGLVATFAAFSALGLLCSVRYFFVLPVVLLGVALLSFGGVLVVM